MVYRRIGESPSRAGASSAPAQLCTPKPPTPLPNCPLLQSPQHLTFVSSVLPTPVGPLNSSVAMGRLGFFRPLLARMMARAVASTASSCPITRPCSAEHRRSQVREVGRHGRGLAQAGVAWEPSGHSAPPAPAPPHAGPRTCKHRSRQLEDVLAQVTPAASPAPSTPTAGQPILCCTPALALSASARVSRRSRSSSLMRSTGTPVQADTTCNTAQGQACLSALGCGRQSVPPTGRKQLARQGPCLAPQGQHLPPPVQSQTCPPPGPLACSMCAASTTGTTGAASGAPLSRVLSSSSRWRSRAASSNRESCGGEVGGQRSGWSAVLQGWHSWLAAACSWEEGMHALRLHCL